MMIDQAYVLLSGGYFKDAVKAFSDCLALESTEARAYRGRGEAYFKLKKWKLAIADFEQARQLDCQEPNSWMGLAMSLVMDNKIYEAIDVYEALLVAQPRFILAHIQLALLYYRLGVIGKGHRQLDLAMDLGPTPQERKRIEDLKKEELILDKKRYYRPDFQALREQNKVGSFSFLKEFRKLFGKHN
jgi:tetratricopeptide (TPR) repeat protein